MSLDPITNAPLVIQIHAACALVALALGPVAIHRRRRDRLHKIIGYVWVAAMLATACSALTIPAHGWAIIGNLGPIHGFAALALWSIWVGMRAIWRGDVAAHMAALRGLYYEGIAIASLFNFLPGRTVNRALLPDHPELGWAVIGIGGAILAIIAWKHRTAHARPV